MKTVLALALSALMSATTFANTVTVFPCPTAPKSDGSCPGPTLQSGQTAAINKDDYYDLTIESTCIDQPDSWWTKKVVMFTVTVAIGNNKAVTIPIYQDRATGAGCHIGVNGFAVMTSIPSNGQSISIQVSVVRSEEKDGLRQILAFATSTAQDSSLSTYTAASLPFTNIAFAMANNALKAFNQPTDPWLTTAATNLHPMSPLRTDRFDLKDGYLVQYSGPDNPLDRDFYVDGGEVRWTNNTLVRNGATWVLFKIQKFPRRNDFPTKTWYQNWQNLLDNTLAMNMTADAFKTQYQQVITLLQNDPDFTFGDKRQYVRTFADIETSIVTALNKQPPDYASIGDAIDASKVSTQQAATKGANGQAITAVNGNLPVVTNMIPVITNGNLAANHGAQPPIQFVTNPKLQTAIDPGKLQSELKARIQ